jgi:hypothetical protein
MIVQCKQRYTRTTLPCSVALVNSEFKIIFTIS